MAWFFVRLGVPNSAVILALALVPIVSLVLDATRGLEPRSAVRQNVRADVLPRS
jgi:hypothetical protein